MFLVKQSPPPGLCPRSAVACGPGLLLANLRRHFAEFLQRGSLKRLGILYRSTCVGLGYGLMEGYFLEPLNRPNHKSDKVGRSLRSVTLSRPRNINLVPIDYAFRPRLRGRLTLLRLALSRNPWTIGDRVSHPVCSLLMSSFSLLIAPPGLTAGLLSKASDVPDPKVRPRWTPFSQNAPLPLLAQPEASARGLSPVTSSPQDNLSRPVSYYAIFKGWLLLSQPPGCFGRPTCFPT